MTYFRDEGRRGAAFRQLAPIFAQSPQEDV